MQKQDLKIGMLIRYIGKERFVFGHDIWKIVDIEDNRLNLTDMRGTYVKTHSIGIIKDFEEFIPHDEPVVKWKTKYLGVVK